jgi:hypothetical protein
MLFTVLAVALAGCQTDTSSGGSQSGTGSSGGASGGY